MGSPSFKHYTHFPLFVFLKFYKVTYFHHSPLNNADTNTRATNDKSRAPVIIIIIATGSFIADDLYYIVR